jgi:single-stranded DNA-binding protein
MQAFANVATVPERKESKSTKRGFYEFRACEGQRGRDDAPTWYTVRVMKDENPLLEKGDFVKVTGKLKADFYVGRDGKPTGTLLIIAFEASKIAKPAALKEDQAGKTSDTPQPAPKALTSASERLAVQEPQQPLEPVRVSVQQEEADWSAMYS